MSTGPVTPLPSELRTPEQMEWIHDRFKVDALERLARSTPDYYETHGNYLPDVAALAHAALAALAQTQERCDWAEQARRRVPSDEGGPGREEQYWMRAKLQAAITHLRDIEDYYRLCKGLPESFYEVRADRARQLYEAITEDFVNGKMTLPSSRERRDAAEARVVVLEAALREIAHAGTDLPHARRRDRDEMRSIAHVALAELQSGEQS